MHWTFVRPTPNDSDGVSLIRKRYRAMTWAAFRPNKPKTRYEVAIVSAKVLRTLAVDAGLGSLSILPTPDDLDVREGHPWAHCVLAEITWEAYSDPDSKLKIKEWAQAVAKSVRTRDVVGPFSVPGPADEYRPKD